jgi:hypothetical protein
MCEAKLAFSNQVTSGYHDTNYSVCGSRYGYGTWGRDVCSIPNNCITTCMVVEEEIDNDYHIGVCEGQV